MSVTKKLKWKRALSKLRFGYEELEYIKEISKDSAVEFEKYYREFCAINKIDIAELDRQNRERLDELYGRNQITNDDTPDESEISDPNESSIVHYNKAPDDASTEDVESYQMTADEIAIHEVFSKLFKQIALKIHPDRIDKNLSDHEIKSRINRFQKVNQAFEDRKYFILLETAEDLGISTPKNYEQQTRWMKQEFNIIDARIEKEKRSYNYGFSECETEEQKDQLIKNFIYHVFRISV